MEKMVLHKRKVLLDNTPDILDVPKTINLNLL